MTMLSRGANAALTGSSVEVAVSGARQGSVDLMVFQLGGDAKVRSDADFVFFNQPESPEGGVRLVAADRVTVDLAAVPPAIQTLAVAVALDDAVPGSLAAIPRLGVTVAAGETHQADASGLTTERAAVLVEIYRRAGVWKVRNVSAGWAAGLSALAGAHGVSVDQAAPALPDPATALPSPNLLPRVDAAGPNRDSRSNPPGRSAEPELVPAGYPMPGGFPPPGGSLPPLPPIVPPRPGGFVPPGGS